MKKSIVLLGISIFLLLPFKEVKSERFTQRIKVSGEILNTKFEIIDNPTLDNSKTSVGDCFYDYDVMTEELLRV